MEMMRNWRRPHNRDKRKRQTASAEELDSPNSRRQFFKKGLLSAFAVGAFSKLAGKGNAEGIPTANDSILSINGGANSSVPVTVTSTGRSSTDFEDLFESIKREASPEELYTFLYALPKGGDLHHHHGGSTFPEHWYKIATDTTLNGGQRYYTRYRLENCEEDTTSMAMGSGSERLMYWVNIHERAWQKLSPCNKREFKPLEALNKAERQAWMASLVLDKPHEGRDEFFEYHWPRINHLFNNPYLMAELLVENMKLFSAEGVRYLEPQVYVEDYHEEEGQLLSPHEIYTIYRNRLNQADALATGVTLRFLLTILRFLPDAPERVGQAFDFIYNHRDLWRGINMAGREDNEKGYPRRFTEAYDAALRKYPGVGIAIHAGEQDEPSSHIIDTLRLGATRIGHGVNLIQDTQTMQLMRSGKFLVEINLVSNHLLKYVDDLHKHPFPIYLRQGIPCCLNTDNRGMWDSNMTDEYYAAVTHFNLSWSELVELGQNSLAFSFAQPAVKTRLLASYKRDIDTFEKKFLLSDWRTPLRSVTPVTHGYGKKYFALKL